MTFQWQGRRWTNPIPDIARKHPLPDSELACIAPMPPEEKRRACRGVKVGAIYDTYNPVRGQLGNIFNATFGEIRDENARPPLAKIERCLERLKKDKEREMNIGACRALYALAEQHSISGYHKEFLPLQVLDIKRSLYWSPYIIIIDGVPSAIFLDPRRRRYKLTPLGKKFVFSVMHRQIRLAHPEDFGDITLGIIQLGEIGKTERVAEINFLNDQLFDDNILYEMVLEAYIIWGEELERRYQENRAKPIPPFELTA
jgi:hypothetical protein